MAKHYTETQENEIRGWLLELRDTLNPVDFVARRERASELVRRLNQCDFEATSTIDTEFQRVRRIWTRMELAASPSHTALPADRLAVWAE